MLLGKFVAATKVTVRTVELTGPQALSKVLQSETSFGCRQFKHLSLGQQHSIPAETSTRFSHSLSCDPIHPSKMSNHNAFKSQRLIYRAIEDNDEDIGFIHSILLDSEGFANGSDLKLVPHNKDAAKTWKKRLEGCIIAVIMCLPASDQDPAPAADTDAKDGRAPAPAQWQPSYLRAGRPTPIGLISLTGSSDMRTAQHRNANIGIDVLPPYQGKGYGSEAIRWITEWGFQSYGLHRIGIESFSHNPGAGRLYERLGFVPEQRKREAVWFRGGWSDLLGFAMLEHEWRERQRQGKQEQTGGDV